MKITKITKRVGRKIGLPQSFSSVTFETELSATIGEKETLEDADQKIWDACEQCLNRDIQRWKEKVKSGRTQPKKEEQAS